MRLLNRLMPEREKGEGGREGGGGGCSRFEDRGRDVSTKPVLIDHNQIFISLLYFDMIHLK